MSKGRQRRSFRFEITLLIGLLFAILVGGMSYGLTRIVYHARINEVDASLLAQAERVPATLARYYSFMTDQRRQRPAPSLELPAGQRIFIWNTDGEVLKQSADTAEVEAILSKLNTIKLDSAELGQPPQASGPGMRPPAGGPPGFSERGPGMRPAPRGDAAPGAAPGPPMIASLCEYIRFTRVETPAGTMRMAAFELNDCRYVLVDDLSSVRAAMTGLYEALYIVVPLTLILAMGGAWLIASRAIRPVKVLATTASQISSSALDSRIGEAGATKEFSELIDIFNAMMDRLERSFQQASRFSADAAHELRTPLTILQGHIELAIQKDEPGSQQQRFHNSLLEDVQRLRNIVSKLLLLARSDAGRLPLQRNLLDFSALVAGLWEDATFLDPKLDYQSAVEPGIHVMGDEDMLTQVVTNLISNAVNHNVPEGRVELILQKTRHSCELRMSNTAEPIAPDACNQLFDRFYRGDESRVAKQGTGAGLGLSLSRELARAHDGELTLESDGRGVVTFVFSLPVADVLQPAPVA
ncbi:MAG: ATP-binding protein [Verrucomicrobiota bacterium]